MASCTAAKRPVEDGEKLVTALLTVVDPAAHLHGDGDVLGEAVADPRDDLQGHCRLAQVEPAAAPSQDLLDRAAKIDIDHIETGLDEPFGRRSESDRIGAHQLSADWMLLVGHVECPPARTGAAKVDQQPVEHDFADRVGGAELPGNDPHRAVAVAGQSGLDNGKVELDCADRQARTVASFGLHSCHCAWPGPAQSRALRCALRARYDEMGDTSAVCRRPV